MVAAFVVFAVTVDTHDRQVTAIFSVSSGLDIPSRILAVIDKISGGKTVWRKEAVSGPRFVDSGEVREHALVPIPA